MAARVRLRRRQEGVMAWGGVLPEATMAAQMEVAAADASMFMPMAAFEEAAERAAQVPQPHVPVPSPVPQNPADDVGAGEPRGAVIVLGEGRQRRGRV